MAYSRSPHYNYFKEKLMLQEEERVLKDMLGKFKDQLNRLKIEELALLTLIKMQEEQSDNSNIRKDQKPVRSLDSISDNASSLSSALPVGVMYENVADLNKELLDLDLTSQIAEDGHSDQSEEEEDDENNEAEDDEIINDYTKDLRSYMDHM